MKLIPNWKRCLRMYSVQAMALAGAIQGAWVFLPEEMKATVPDNWLKIITMLVLGLGILGRLVPQKKVDR